MTSKSQLTPAMFEILLTLSDGERHGYAIMREIAARTNGEVRVGAATLYRCIKRLLESGFIAESGDRPDPALDDERRRYYRLTELGEKAAHDEAVRLARLVDAALRKRLIEPGWAGTGGKS